MATKMHTIPTTVVTRVATYAEEERQRAGDAQRGVEQPHPRRPAHDSLAHDPPSMNDHEFPDQELPDHEFPDQELPDHEFPDHVLSDGVPSDEPAPAQAGP